MSSYLAPSSLPSGSVNSGHRVVNGHVARFFGLAKWLALLLLSVVPPTVGANPPDSWVIGDVVIEDSELFDEDYLRDRASESMTAVIDDISIEFGSKFHQRRNGIDILPVVAIAVGRKQ